MSKATAALFALAALLVFACGGVDETGSEGEELSSGVYVPKATVQHSAAYIGDMPHEWGYVLGWLEPGSKIYAREIQGDSVYGLVTNSHYGAWDAGHHCGWVSLKHVNGHGLRSHVADSCPPSNNAFSLIDHKPTGFRKGSWIECNGCVQRAVVLPTCSDFNVYANYDPVTHTFHDVDGLEVAGRGTVYGSTKPVIAGVQVTEGYAGFGTRFVTTDDVAVEIKDTQRNCNVKGGCTSFGFMHADCIAGDQVGNPAGHGPTKPPSKPAACGEAFPGQGFVANGSDVKSCNGRYSAAMESDGNLVLRDLQENARAIWSTNTANKGAYVALFQPDGNLVVYDYGQNPLWASNTAGKGGVRLAFQDDGNVVLYDASSQAVWSTGTAGQ